MRIVSFFSFLLFCIIASAQKKDQFNITLAFGASYIFNDESLNRLPGISAQLGLNYQFHTKGRQLIFVPALVLQKNRYRAAASKSANVEVDQDLLTSHLDVLMKVHNHVFVRVGLFFQYVLFSSVIVNEKDLYGKTNYSYGNSVLEQGYEENPFQSGFCIGLSFPFKLFKHEHKFNIKYSQIVSSVVRSDYILTGFFSEDCHVLSVKAHPSIFTFGFDIQLQRIKKKNEEKDQ